MLNIWSDRFKSVQSYREGKQNGSVVDLREQSVGIKMEEERDDVAERGKRIFESGVYSI